MTDLPPRHVVAALRWPLCAALTAIALLAHAEPSATSPLITDPAQLAALQANPLRFGRAVFGSEVEDLPALYREQRGYRDLCAVIEGDVSAEGRRHPRARVGMASAERLFDLRWLRSPDVRFDLVGVSLRLDRQPFATRTGTCGELRAIYRLAYRTRRHGEADGSRLPLTVNATRWLPGDCHTWAKRWQSDPIAVSRGFSSLPMRAVELNVQTVRLPSTMRPDLGGDALYALRALQPASDGLQPGLLENQPDGVRLSADPALRAALSAFLADPATHAAIDAGIARAPESLLARAAVSVAPHGLARAANRPWTALASATDVQALGAGDLQLGQQRLRRLDQQACSGCHHARSVAGFHLLGAGVRAADGVPMRVIGALARPASPHLEADLPRRTAALQTWARGQAPDLTRPPAEAPRQPMEAGEGERCGLRLERGWRCGAGLSCLAIDDEDVGNCHRPRPGIGNPCLPGALTTVNGRETVSRPQRRACSGPRSYCESPRVGFPSGLCAAACDPERRAEGRASDPDACAGIPGIIAFNACLARGAPFAACVAAALRPARLARCDLNRPCREDYACAHGPTAADVCMPPYFLQELRVDGHARLR